MLSIIDWDTLRQVTSGDRGMEQQLSVEFTRTARQCLHSMHECLRDMEDPAWETTVETLRVASGRMHAFWLARLCDHAENAETPRRRERTLRMLKTELSRVTTELPLH